MPPPPSRSLQLLTAHSCLPGNRARPRPGDSPHAGGSVSPLTLDAGQAAGPLTPAPRSSRAPSLPEGPTELVSPRPHVGSFPLCMLRPEGSPRGRLAQAPPSQALAAGEPSSGHKPRVTAPPHPEQCCRTTRHEATPRTPALARFLAMSADLSPDVRHHNAPSLRAAHPAFLLPRVAPFLCLGGFLPVPFAPISRTPSALLPGARLSCILAHPSIPRRELELCAPAAFSPVARRLLPCSPAWGGIYDDRRALWGTNDLERAGRKVLPNPAASLTLGEA